MSFSVGDLVAHLRFDDREFRAGISRTQNGLNRLRGPLTTIAAGAAGANSQAVRLVSTLGMLGLGGGVTAAILAAATPIVTTFNKWSDAAKKYDEALSGASKRLDEIIRKRAQGGQLGAFEDMVSAQTRAGEIRRERADILANPRALFGQLTKGQQAAVARLSAELAAWERRVDAAKVAMQEGIPAIEGITVAVAKLKTLADVTFGPGLRSPSPTLTGGGRIAMDGTTRLRRITRDNLGMGGGATDNAVRGPNIGGFIRSLFDPKQFATSLLSGGISTLIGGAMGAIGGLFNQAASRLADAMEQNTRALRATADFLAERLTESGFGVEAKAIAKALQETINRIAVGDLESGLPGLGQLSTLMAELAKVGIDADTFRKVAASLGIDVGSINADILQQFLDQLTKAGSGLDELENSARRTSEALRNVPSGFKVALAAFNATVAIDARGQSPEAIALALQREFARMQARGGGGGFENRGPD